MCSTLTQESNYRAAHRSLRAAFPRLESLRTARESDIAAAIARGGLSRRKAAAICSIVDRLVNEFGRPTLAPLARREDGDCEDFLLTLPLVGRKTARWVMMYSLGREVFPVDRHCWRVARRLGWVATLRRDGTCCAADEDGLQELIPPDLRLSLHVNLISFGRDVCRAQQPRCEVCPLVCRCPQIGVEPRRVRPTGPIVQASGSA